MQGSLFFILLLSIFPASVSRAQESVGTQPASTQAVSREQTAPVAQHDPPAKSQKPEEEHPRLFWIFPTYSVADSKSARPLAARGKWRLFVKNETDPFTVGWVAFEAGLAQANNDFPDMARVLPGTARDSAPDWLMKRQPGSWNFSGRRGRSFFLSYANSWCEQVRPELMRTAVLTNPHPSRNTG